MNTNTGLDRRAAAWLADGPTVLSDRVLDAALREVHLTQQRRDRWILRRFTLMSSSMRLAAGIAIVAIVGLGTFTFLGRNSGPGGTTPPATPTPSAVPTARPTAAVATIQPLSQTFESAVHGLSIGYPAGWGSQRATAARSAAQWESDTGPVDIFDYLRAPGAVTQDDLPGAAQFVLRVTSVPAPKGVPLEAWISQYVTGTGGDCLPPTVALVDIEIDGRPALLRDSCGELEASVEADGRIYIFTLFVNASAANGRAMFDALAETMTLRPAEAQRSPTPS